MQNPTNQAEAASIPTETVLVSEQAGSHLLDPTFTVRWKAAKRSERWYQPFFTPARKKLRLDAPVPAAADEVDRETASPGVSAGLSPPAAAIDNDANNANNADLASDTQPKTGANEAMGPWTAEEDAELTTAVAKTKKKLWGKNHVMDWVSVAALVTGRTAIQCERRWHVPGRGNIQCQHSWKNYLRPSMALRPGRKGGWKEEEDLKLMNSVQMHGNKDWVRMAELVPSRSKNQCYYRWRNVLYPSVIMTDGRTGMDRRRRPQPEGCGANAQGQGLGANLHAGPESNEKTVL
jgi:hypothetical protein